jgi:signal transduction histidine kinase
MIYTKTKREKYITLYVYLVLTSIYIYGIIELNLNIIFTIFLAITFYFILNYTLNLLQKVEDIVFYSNAVTSLEEEKHLRTALFKITHEIKNPIAVCKGYLDMFDVENKEHSRKYIPIIKNEITKLLTLLQDFLAINKVRLDIETMDIYYLIENIERSITPLLKEKNIELICDTPDDELYIEGDYNRLNQVFINIIKNAVESMEEKENKKLEIKTKVIDEKIKIEVTDTGMGMSVQDMEKLKEPFFTTKRNGTGLGVYLSREILKEHGGKLVYSSKEKIGTTVTATLPIKKDILFS